METWTNTCQTYFLLPLILFYYTRYTACTVYTMLYNNQLILDQILKFGIMNACTKITKSHSIRSSSYCFEIFSPPCIYIWHICSCFIWNPVLLFGIMNKGTKVFLVRSSSFWLVLVSTLTNKLTKYLITFHNCIVGSSMLLSTSIQISVKNVSKTLKCAVLKCFKEFL